jgi:hypothetical protein
MKKPPLCGSGQVAESDLNLPAIDAERCPLRDWLTGETWAPLVIAGAWHPHRVSNAHRKLWPHKMRSWCPRRKAYLYSWHELQEIAAFLGQEKWR